MVRPARARKSPRRCHIIRPRAGVERKENAARERKNQARGGGGRLDRRIMGAPWTSATFERTCTIRV
ncbi:hypothetical protein FA95DRAFT_1565265 [Auriscalpium vulgare]|uniref:Uncharacterized protein n=1 Tax=Auriscalpium vulgare TaxID=40419 RepID=A0ACB8RC82_9AGAM|nr:hypothetical protein FA95DRAFT_1565265 [Auriscalpium vulgare]